MPLDENFKRAFDALYTGLGWPRERYTRQRLAWAAHEAKLVIWSQSKRIVELEDALAKKSRRRVGQRPETSGASGMQGHSGTTQYANGPTLPAPSSACEAVPAGAVGTHLERDAGK